MIIEKSSEKGIILTDHDYRNVLDISNMNYLLFDGGVKRVNTLQDLLDWGYIHDRK
jgi:lipopolysaccharide export system ATP-binding protein